MTLYRLFRALLLSFSLLFFTFFSASCSTTALASNGSVSADYERADLRQDYTQYASLPQLPEVLIEFKSLPAQREHFIRRVGTNFNLPLELYLNRRTALLMDTFLKDLPDVGVMFGFRVTGNLTQI